MIVGLIGASCSGKSVFLSLLRENGFTSPQCVTTRESRGSDELWHLISITKELFHKLNDSKRLCFIARTFENYYACMDFPYKDADVAVIIRPENVEELRAMGGLVIYIQPFDNSYCLQMIKTKSRNNYQMRVLELVASPNVFEVARPDIVFVNRYDEESKKEFLKMIYARRGMN